jgi:hypothetical protein
MAKMSTLPLNIQRLKLVKIVATDVRFGSTCKFYFIFTIVGSTPSTSIVRKRNEIRKHGIKLTFLTIFFCNGNI